MTIYEKAKNEFEKFKEALDEKAHTMSGSELVDRNCYRYFMYCEIFTYIENWVDDYVLKDENQNVLPAIYDDYMEYEEGGRQSMEYAIDDFLTNYCEDKKSIDK